MKTRTYKCKLARCSVKISNGTYCSKSCASKGQDRSKRKPGGFALLTAEQRAAIYKKRNRSKKYKETRTKSFELINERRKIDPEFHASIGRATSKGQLASEYFRKVSAATLNRLRKDPEAEARRRFAVADACRGRNFGKPNKCIPNKEVRSAVPILA